MRMTLADIARCLGQDPSLLSETAAQSRPCGAAADSREVERGALFFCLPGARADGHDFAAQAVRAGALALVGTRNPFGEAPPPVPLFLVPDAVKALGAIAACHRDTASARVIGLTGTAGKTSVKEALAAVLALKGDTARNPLNRNNQIGLPLSMLNASGDAAHWVMEAGISEAHDMDELGAMLKPDTALILNVGEGHLQGLGDKGVAYYKARLLRHLRPDGLGLVSADYPDLVREAATYGRPLRCFSVRPGAAPYTARYLDPADSGYGLYEVRTPEERGTLRAPFQGVFGAENVAAVAAVAHSLGFSLKDTARGLAASSLPPQRFCARELGFCLLFDDSYNANPLSMARMLEAAAGMAEKRREPLLLVLGEMLELGTEAAALHARLGGQIAAVNPLAVVWKGGNAEAVESGLRNAGYRGRLYPVAGEEEFRRALAAMEFSKGVALFKGSRGNRLETLVAAFTALMGQQGERNAL